MPNIKLIRVEDRKEPTRQTLYTDWTFVPAGVTFSIDSVEDSFILRVKSLSGVKAETIKKLLENKLEVLEIIPGDRIEWVKK